MAGIAVIEQKCSVCEDEPAVGVACVPGVPVSMAYGRKCLDANAHPWGILVGNTVIIGGLANASDWWRAMVDDTCKHLSKTLDEFNADVAKQLAEMDAEMSAYPSNHASDGVKGWPL